MVLTPRPYQAEDAEWLVSKKRAALHHDPGIGKTLIAAQAATQNLPALVVAPNYLTAQWEDFLNEQYNMPTYEGVGFLQKKVSESRNLWVQNAAKGSKANRLQSFFTIGPSGQILIPDFTIINKEMLRTFPIQSFYKTVIFDEAHHFRHRESAVSKEALKLATNTEYVYELTATPIFREPDDLYQQIRMLNPNPKDSNYDEDYYLTSYDRFIYHFCHVETGGWGRRVHGGYTSRIKTMLEKYAKRRTYREVSLYLPRLIESVVSLDWTPDARKRYDQIRYQYRDEAKDLVFTNAMQVMQALRRATCTPEKLDACVDLIPGPSIIFTWYRETAHRMHGALEKSGRKSVCITGDIPVSERIRLAKSHEYVVATIESLSEGCDLTHTKTVIFVEEYYTPGMMKQAMSRVRRFTENHGPVMAYYLHMRNSIDEIIHSKQKDRAATAESIVKEALEF